MKKLFTSIQTALRQPTARELAEREYAEAQRQLLAARTDLDRANATVVYRTNQTRRLEEFLAQG